jgi:hypothetical protein
MRAAVGLPGIVEVVELLTGDVEMFAGIVVDPTVVAIVLEVVMSVVVAVEVEGPT